MLYIRDTLLNMEKQLRIANYRRNIDIPTLAIPFKFS